MKIGVFFPGFDPTTGGGHTFEQEMIRALLALCTESPHEFILYSNTNISNAFDDICVPGKLCAKLLDPSIYFPPAKWFFSRVMHKMGITQRGIHYEDILQAAIIQDRVQVVWFATFSYLPVDIPYIATVWDIDHRLKPWFPELSQDGVWEQRDQLYSTFLQRATCIIAPNQAGQDALTLFYQIPPERICQLAHPVPHIGQIPAQAQVNSVREKYGIRGKYIFYPAQFWAHKNHINLLKAFELVRNKHRLEIELVLAGSDKGNFDFVQSTARELGLEESIHFVKFVPREDLIALYTGALALTYMSYGGPENLPPLEAFACGCPVIAADVAGAIEQLGDNAIRVNPSNPEKIALVIKELHDDTHLRQRLIERGLIRAQKFTSDDYVRGVFDILDQFASIRMNWP